MSEIIGTNGNDTIAGTVEDDILDGLSGNDTINGLGGNDRIIGGAGNDVINGGDGDDSLIGEAGTDVLSGGGGRDVIIDDEGRRTTIDGGDGDDVISVTLTTLSATDHSLLLGGAGGDGFLVRVTGPGRVTIDGGAPANGTPAFYRDVVQIEHIPTGGISITGVDEITFSDSIYSTGTITIADFNPALKSFYGINLVQYAQSALSVYGYRGGYSPFEQGFMSMEQRGADTVIMLHVEGTTSDFIVLQNVTMGDLDFRNIYHGTDSQNSPSLQGWWSVGNEIGSTISGTVSADILTGTRGGDHIFGLDGDDVINGGVGNDTLTGGAGADRFQFNAPTVSVGLSGQDIITDFNTAEDTIDLPNSGFLYWSDIQAAMRQVGNDVVIDLRVNCSVTLQNVAMGDLSAANFVDLRSGSPLVEQISMMPPPGTTRVLDSAGDGSHHVLADQSIFGAISLFLAQAPIMA